MAARWNLLTFDIKEEGTVHAHVDTIKIESDEAGFELHIETDEGDRFVFNIHGCADELLDACVKRIGPWVAEGQAVKAEYDRVKRDAYPEDDGPWPGESALAFWQRTGNDDPLRDQADLANKARKEN